MDETKNLTNPSDIRHAIERQGGGYGSLTRLAKSLGVSKPALSMNVNGSRYQENILAEIATHLGQPVYGVQPRTKRRT